jgi:hypothetical protein
VALAFFSWADICFAGNHDRSTHHRATHEEGKGNP